MKKKPMTTAERTMALLKTVVTPKEFAEYRRHRHITVKTKEGVFTISCSHFSFRPKKNPGYYEQLGLCVIFGYGGRGCPPRDSLIMKYILAKNPKLLWATARQFPVVPF